MNENTIKKLRLITPFVITFILCWYYFGVISGKTASLLGLWDYALIIFVSIAMAVIYYFLNLRSVVTSYKYNMVELNVKRTIFKLYTDDVSENQKQYLFKSDSLKNIYFSLIDGDDYLEKKKKHISNHGFIWTSTADIGIIGFLCSIAFFISIIFLPEKSNELITNGFGIVLLSILTLVAHNFSFLKLIKLSNDQLAYIEKNKINKLDLLMKKALTKGSED